MQTEMVCNTFAKQYPEDDQDKKSWAQKKGLSYDNPLFLLFTNPN